MTAVVVSVKKNGMAIVEYTKPSHAVSVIIIMSKKKCQYVTN